jgi:hypothetical protein
MEDCINLLQISCDTINNELKLVTYENEVTQYPAQYYIKHRNTFYTRSGERVDSIQRINNKQAFMLQEIIKIFRKNNTKYKVVISPLYDQVKFSQKDMIILKKIFRDKLYDFSGENSFTENKMNYYETSHYRPVVGDSILNIIYRGSSNIRPQIKNNKYFL